MQHSNALNPFNHRAEYSLNACAVHPRISMYILHTVLYAFRKVLTRRRLVGDYFLYCRYLNVRFRGDTVEIICESLLRGKGSTQYEWLFLTQYKPFELYRFIVQDSTTTSPIGAITKKKFSHF